MSCVPARETAPLQHPELPTELLLPYWLPSRKAVGIAAPIRAAYTQAVRGATHQEACWPATPVCRVGTLRVYHEPSRRIGEDNTCTSREGPMEHNT